MSNLGIRNCILSYKCDQSWESLESTRDESIKFCLKCQKEVHYCRASWEIARAIQLNRCIAIPIVGALGNGPSHDIGIP
jgi:hypothetical protein